MPVLHVLDLEADGLYHEWETQRATRIDCVCVLTVDTTRDIEHNLEIGKQWKPEPGSFVIFQNGIDYDLPMLAHHWGWQYDLLPDTLQGQRVQFLDTRLLSQLLNPDRKLPDGWAEHWAALKTGRPLPGPHSLATWAYKLGLEKPQLVYGENIGRVPHEISVQQCKSDCEQTLAMYRALLQEARELGVQIKKPLQIEQAVRHIMTQGATEGVWFDTELAERCVPELDALMQELAERVEPQLPARPLPKGKVKLPPKKRFKKGGTPTALAEKYFGDALRRIDFEDNVIPEKGHQWTVVCYDGMIPLKDWPEDKPFGEATEPTRMANLGDIKDWLIQEHGWKPTLWNEKRLPDGSKERTSPKFQQQGKLCADLERLAEVTPLVQDICTWLSYRNRRSVIKSENGTGWLNHPRLAIDNRLPADADTMGTGTFRMTHRVVANIPRKSSVYGEQMRSLFRAPPGYVMVGWDASQLEDRCKAHYCYPIPGGPEYCDKILDPEFDVHGENAEAWGMPRQKTKNGHYAIQYFCQPQKLADTLGIDLPTAEQYHADWWQRNEPLALFADKVQRIWHEHDKKYLPAIDGRLVPTRKKHALVNTLFQSAGVIAMKWAMVLWWCEVRRRDLPAVQVIHYHDEVQCICPPEFADEVGGLGVWSIRRAGELLNFRVPLTADYQIGSSWSETH